MENYDLFLDFEDARAALDKYQVIFMKYLLSALLNVISEYMYMYSEECSYTQIIYH